RAAEASLAVQGTATRTSLEAYAEGVNAYVATHSLPSEYSLLEVTKIPPWTPVDSIAVGKLIAFGLSFDLDLDATVALISYQTAGKIVGFDGSKLFADTWRVAPFTKAATIPDASGAGSTLPEELSVVGCQLSDTGAGAEQPTTDNRQLDADFVRPETVALLRELSARLREIAVLQAAMDPEKHAGSNEWAIAPRNSATGNALIANDPHLSLVSPANFYPISLRAGKTNVAGMSFP